MTNNTAAYADLEIRIPERLDQWYRIEITLGGGIEFPACAPGSAAGVAVPAASSGTSTPPPAIGVVFEAPNMLRPIACHGLRPEQSRPTK